MRGSLGVWAEPLRESEQLLQPILELHINVWRDLPGGRSSIDFGFQLSELDNMNRMFLYVPARIGIDEIEDLSEVLKFRDTLSAVFNDTVEITKHNDDSFDISRNDGPEFRILELRPERDFDIEYVPLPDEESGSVVKFSAGFCARIRQSPNGTAYFRVRVHLSPKNGEIFYSYASPADSWLLSRFYRTELNEFRLNERRSFPDMIANWSRGSEFRISRVLYFLIRDFRYELLVQHAQFKRTRRLETKIWQDYLAPPGQRGSAAALADVGERMLIYQWREDAALLPNGNSSLSTPANRKWIEDFSAFASFRSPKDNIWGYMIAILALGALGSGLQAVTLALVSYFLPIASTSPSAAGIAIALQTFICFMVLVVLLTVIGSADFLGRTAGRLTRKHKSAA